MILKIQNYFFDKMVVINSGIISCILELTIYFIALNTDRNAEINFSRRALRSFGTTQASYHATETPWRDGDRIFILNVDRTFFLGKRILL